MNAETLAAIVEVISHIDDITSRQGVTLIGSVKVGDRDAPDTFGYLSFNDGSETTFVAA